MGEHWGRVGEEVPICYVAHFLLVYIERRRNWVRGAKRRGSSAGRQIRRPTGTPTSSLRMHIVIAGECCFLPVGMGGVVRPVNRQPCRCADIFTVCLLPPDLPSLLPPPTTACATRQISSDCLTSSLVLGTMDHRCYNWLAHQLIDVCDVPGFHWRSTSASISCLALAGETLRQY